MSRKPEPGPPDGTVSIPPPAAPAPPVDGTVSIAAPAAAAAPPAEGTISVGPVAPGAAAGTPSAAAAAPSGPRPVASDLQLGDLPPEGRKFGQYLLKSELGRGGMGVVFRGLHLALNREVAIKLMLSDEVPELERQRFLREAEASAALKHPNIVAVHDVGIEEGKLFFSMDFIEGDTFKKVIETRKDDLALVLRIFAKVCDGVGYAHRKGIIHRDLKPQNVMVAADGEPHIMDFGLAHRLDEASKEREKAEQKAEAKKKARLTRVGSILGTPVYMPPEQAAGRLDEIDTRSDVYSLGIILYYLLSGDVPFRAPSQPELFLMIESEPPPPPRTRNAACPWELERIALKAIEKKREDRYPTAFDLKADIEAWLEGRPVEAVGGGALYRAGKLVRRNRGIVAVSAVAFALLVGGGVYGVRQAGADRRERQAMATSLVAEGRADLGAAEAARLDYEARRGPALEAKAGRALLAAASSRYGAAFTKFQQARGLDPESVAASAAAGEAALGQQATKSLDDQEVERQARADAAREARERASGIAKAGNERLEKVKPDGANDLEAVRAAKAEVDAARSAFIQALVLDGESKAASDGLTAVVAKLEALGARETVFARKARLDELGTQAASALAAGEEAAKRKDAAAARADLRRAMTLLDEARRIDDASSTLKERRVDAALAFGRLVLDERFLELAEHVVAEVAPIDDGRGRVTTFLADVKRQSDDERRFQEAMERAGIALAAERWNDAAAAFEEARAAARDRPEAEFGIRFARGGAAAAAGRHEEALAHYADAEPFAARGLDRTALERAVKRERTALADASLGAAQAAVKAQRFDEALAALDKALGVAPDHAEARRLKDELEARKRVPPGTVLVTEGAFTFGDGAEAREGVKCAAFFVGVHEVTNREFLEFVAAGGYDEKKHWDDEGFAARASFMGRDGAPGPATWVRSRPPEGKDDLPVAGVSWFEARAYVRWKGAGWRLPTEVEWEKAATWDAAGGARAPLPWLAGGGGSAGAAAASTWPAVWQPYFNRTEPKAVGAPIAKEEGRTALHDRSPSGTFDMWGNVRELVTARDGDREVAAARGGSFLSRTEERSTPYKTFRPSPTYRAQDVGFRLARSAGP